jgi:hypothetical protein
MQQQIINQLLKPCRMFTETSFGRENITKTEALENLEKHFTEKRIAQIVHQNIPAQKALNVHQQVTNQRFRAHLNDRCVEMEIMIQ